MGVQLLCEDGIKSTPIGEDKAMWMREWTQCPDDQHLIGLETANISKHFNAVSVKCQEFSKYFETWVVLSKNWVQE